MDTKLEARLKELLTQEGFADVRTESTASSIAISAEKDHTIAYILIAEGVSAKGTPVTRYVPGPKAHTHDAKTRVPSAHIVALESLSKTRATSKSQG